MQAQAMTNVENAVDTHSIVHLGAGKCSELESYLATQAVRIVLVDANPSVIHTLKQKSTGAARIEIIEAAISEQTGPVTLNLFNLADASSLHAPTGLLQLFPGLKISQQLQVKTQTAAAIIQPLKLYAAHNNLLVIDIPGEERSTLEALQAEGLLEQFAQIQLHCGIAELYEDSGDASHIIQLLQQAGFDLVQQDDRADPDRPYWLLQRNGLKLENAQLQQQLTTLEKEKGATADRIAALSMQLDIVEKDSAAQQVLAEDLAKQLQAAEAAKTELTQQRDQHKTAREAADKAKTEQQARAEELAKQLQAAEVAKKELCQQRDQQKAAREAADKAKAEQQTRAEELAKQLQAAEAAKTELTQQRDQQKTAREAADKAKAEQQALAEERAKQLQVAEVAKTELCQQRDQQKAAREAADKAKAEQQALAEELAKQLQAEEAAKTELTQQRDQFKSQLDTVNNDLNTQQAQIENLTKQLHTADTTNKEFLQQNDQLQTRHEQSVKAIADHKAQLEQLSKNLNERTDLLEQNRQDTSIALRLQSVREVDLKELQERYAALRSTSAQQEELLRKLTDKLSLAATYLQRLEHNTSKKGPHLPKAIVGELVDALSGRDGSPANRDES